jgi:phospholipid/cholesterol/gamma-HCH transport system substrate-binding protein
MDSRRETVVVGLVVLVAFAVVLWTVFFLRGYLSRQDQEFYSAAYEQVGLLMVGDNVTVAGVPVGRVQSIALEGRKAVVHFTVNGGIELNDNSVALIDASDVFGEAYVQLELNEGQPVEPGARIGGDMAPGLRDLIKEGVDVARNTNILLDDARTLVNRIDTLMGPGSTFHRTLGNVERITESGLEFSSRFDNYGRLLEETLASLDSAAVRIRRAVDENQDDLSSVLAGLENASSRLDTMLVEIEDGRGTLGRMLNDERLYEDLRATTLEARNLLREFREQPDKFINLSPF